MSIEGWFIFATFWVLFVVTPGPNAVNCISNGIAFGFRKSLWGVAAILTQATAFLLLSAAGITALITTSPDFFFAAKIIGAAVLIWLGIRGWRNASKPVKAEIHPPHHIYLHALTIATVNAKSIAGYLAAFTQFVQPDIPVWEQMSVILPTALTLTALSYTGFTAIGAGLGKAALGTVFATWFRKLMGGCFILYGAALGGAAAAGRIG